jgi:hypothetical protein
MARSAPRFWKRTQKRRQPHDGAADQRNRAPAIVDSISHRIPMLVATPPSVLVSTTGALSPLPAIITTSLPAPRRPQPATATSSSPPAAPNPPLAQKPNGDSSVRSTARDNAAAPLDRSRPSRALGSDESSPCPSARGARSREFLLEDAAMAASASGSASLFFDSQREINVAVDATSEINIFIGSFCIDGPSEVD